MAALLAARDRFDFGEDGRMSLDGSLLREWWRLGEHPVEDGAWVAEREGEVVAYVHADRERDLANLED